MRSVQYGASRETSKENHNHYPLRNNYCTHKAPLISQAKRTTQDAIDLEARARQVMVRVRVLSVLEETELRERLALTGEAPRLRATRLLERLVVLVSDQLLPRYAVIRALNMTM